MKIFQAIAIPTLLFHYLMTIFKSTNFFHLINLLFVAMEFSHIYFPQHFQKIMDYNRLMQKYINEKIQNFMKRGSVPIGRPVKFYCKKTNTS